MISPRNRGDRGPSGIWPGLDPRLVSGPSRCTIVPLPTRKLNCVVLETVREATSKPPKTDYGFACTCKLKYRVDPNKSAGVRLNYMAQGDTGVRWVSRFCIWVLCIWVLCICCLVISLVSRYVGSREGGLIVRSRRGSPSELGRHLAATPPGSRCLVVLRWRR